MRESSEVRRERGEGRERGCALLSFVGGFLQREMNKAEKGKKSGDDTPGAEERVGRGESSERAALELSDEGEADLERGVGPVAGEKGSVKRRGRRKRSNAPAEALAGDEVEVGAL